MSSYGLPPPPDEVAPRETKAWRQAANLRRAAVGDRLWTAQAREGLDLSNPEALSRYLAGMGITEEIGGGRHLRRLFMGDLPSEGFGMSPGRPDTSYALEAYMPDWKRWTDRAVQRGVPRGAAGAQFFPWLQGGMSGPGSLGEPPPFTSAATFTAPTQDAGGSGLDASASAMDLLRKKRRGMTLGTL